MQIRASKARFILTCFCFFGFHFSESAHAASTNLVINGDFEDFKDYTTGKDYCDYIFKSGQGREPLTGYKTLNQGWWATNLFKSCFNDFPMSTWRKYAIGKNELPEFGVPRNSFGYQDAKSGSSYALVYDFFSTMWIGSTQAPNMRGGIVGSLSAPLVAGKVYAVKFYASLPEIVTRANRIGLYFLTHSQYFKLGRHFGSYGSGSFLQGDWVDSTDLLTSIRVGAQSKGDILDTKNWVEVSGVYQAQGDEEAFFIGNLSDAREDVGHHGPDCSDPEYCFTSHSSYGDLVDYTSYYVDDVQVSCETSSELSITHILLNRCDLKQVADFRATVTTSNPNNQLTYELSTARWNSSSKVWDKILALNDSASPKSWTFQETINLNPYTLVAGDRFNFKVSYQDVCTGATASDEKILTIEEKYLGHSQFTLNGIFQSSVSYNRCKDKVNFEPNLDSDVKNATLKIYSDSNPSLKFSQAIKSNQSVSILDLKVPWAWKAGKYWVEMQFTPSCPDTPVVHKQELILSEDLVDGEFFIDGKSDPEIKSNLCSDPFLLSFSGVGQREIDFTIYREDQPQLTITYANKQARSIKELTPPVGWIWGAGTYMIEMKITPKCAGDPVIKKSKWVITEKMIAEWKISKNPLLKDEVTQLEDITPGVLKRQWKIDGAAKVAPDLTSRLVSALYSDEGIFNIELTVDGLGSCHASKTGTIQVIDKPFIAGIPDIFSPNQNELNDHFFPIGRNFSFELKVFNRWGEKIYESQSKEDGDSTGPKGWDGTNKGVDSPVGLYIYKIFIYDKVYSFSVAPNFYGGSVTLVR